MKTEKEISEQVASLKTILTGAKPGCHCLECFGNSISLSVLLWVLGELESIQPGIDRQNKLAAKLRSQL